MLVGARGKPQMIVSDNGTEFTSNAMLGWAKDHGVDWHYIALGQTDAERLHRVLQRPDARRAFHESLFIDLDQARRLIGAWVTDYNTAEAALIAWLQNAGCLCRYTHCAEGRNVGRGSKRRWMKVQWQVTRIPSAAQTVTCTGVQTAAASAHDASSFRLRRGSTASMLRTLKASSRLASRTRLSAAILTPFCRSELPKAKFLSGHPLIADPINWSLSSLGFIRITSTLVASKQ